MDRVTLENKLEDFIKTDSEFIRLQKEAFMLHQQKENLSAKRIRQLKKFVDTTEIDAQIIEVKAQMNQAHDQSMNLLKAVKQNILKS